MIPAPAAGPSGHGSHGAGYGATSRGGSARGGGGGDAAGAQPDWCAVQNLARRAQQLHGRLRLRLNFLLSLTECRHALRHGLLDAQLQHGSGSGGNGVSAPKPEVGRVEV